MNDDEQSKVLPTRHSDTRPDGGAMGSAVERQMRASVPDTNSFNTRFNTNPDGSVTRLRTRGGMCEYVTEQLPTTTPEKKPAKVYMESGQLEYTWPGEGNPTRSYSAKWHFLDINPSGDYLGYIRYQNPSDIGTQDNDPALSESMDSLAVGYPKKTTAPADDASREAYANATIAKKMIMSMFPASLYSGKMRSFMQALYGAKEDNSSPLGLKVAGSSFVLTYTRTDIELTLGLWAHNSPGIFTAVDINGDTSFWLLSVTSTQFTAYPIKQDAAGKELLKTYNSSTITDRTKLEPYIFAHSFIALTEGTIYPISGMPSGAPLAYGWKFNSTGSKASIVLHEQVGSYGSLKWRAWECHLNFTFSDGAFSVATAATNYGYWTDGWGVFNIFAPEYDIASRLECVSIAMAPGVAPAFNFSALPVYGYYIDDIWEPVMMSRTVSYKGSSVREETTSGMTFDSHVVFSDPTYQPNWHWGYYLRNASYNISYSTEKTSMTVSFSGASYSGNGKYGNHEDGTFNLVQVGGDLGLAPGYGALNAVAAYGTGQFDQGASAPGWSAYISAINNNEFPTNTLCVSHTHAQGTHTRYNYSGWRVNNAWALVIPGLDAEAIYIPHREFHTTATTGTKFVSVSDPVMWWIQTAHTISGSTIDIVAYSPTLYWVSEESQTTTTEPPPLGTVGVACSNTEIINSAGTPAYSYSSIFTVDKTYPYYDPGMFFFTSYGGRYIGSEGIKSPNSVRSQDRFVGWA